MSGNKRTISSDRTDLRWQRRGGSSDAAAFSTDRLNITPDLLSQFAAWLKSRPSTTSVMTVNQVIGGTVAPVVSGPAVPPPATSGTGYAIGDAKFLPALDLGGCSQRANWTTPALPAGAHGISFGLRLSNNGTQITDDYAMYDTLGALAP